MVLLPTHYSSVGSMSRGNMSQEGGLLSNDRPCSAESATRSGRWSATGRRRRGLVASYLGTRVYRRPGRFRQRFNRRRSESAAWPTVSGGRGFVSGGIEFTYSWTRRPYSAGGATRSGCWSDTGRRRRGLVASCGTNRQRPSPFGEGRCSYRTVVAGYWTKLRTPA